MAQLTSYLWPVYDVKQSTGIILNGNEVSIIDMGIKWIIPIFLLFTVKTR